MTICTKRATPGVALSLLDLGKWGGRGAGLQPRRDPRVIPSSVSAATKL